MVSVVDYGCGNLLGVRRAFERCDVTVNVISHADDLLAAKRVILPGVGAFSSAMRALSDRGLIDALRTVADNGVPLLGICLGMQLLFDESEEFGLTQGLGLISGRVVAIPRSSGLSSNIKVPHIGWNNLLRFSSRGWEGTILADISTNSAVYFLHSFMATLVESDTTLAECQYGGHMIPAVVTKHNVVGCQFHPERSGEIGLSILKRFVMM
jgi:glutamine amidotransferase